MNYQIASIRSIACLFVLITHISAVFYIATSSDFQNSFIAYLNQFSRFGTPLFCVITGFLFAKYFYNNLNIKAFYKSRIQKIFIPYLLWSVVYVIIMYIFSPKLFLNFTTQPIFNFLTGKTFYHLYFISVILQFCLIFPLLCYFKKVNIGIILFISFLINLASLYFLHTSEIYFLSDRAFLGNWIFYFIFGIFFYNLKDLKIHKYLNFFILFLILIAISLEIHFSSTFFESTRTQNLFYIPLLFLFLYNLFYNIKSPAILNIGYYSMGIYLVHPIIILGIEKFTPKDILFFSPSVSFIGLYIITLTMCLIFCTLVSKLSISKYIITTPKKQEEGLTPPTPLSQSANSPS